MRVKIVSGGTRETTSVVDVATGEALEHVHAISWVITASGGIAAATITLLDDIEVELESDAVVITGQEARQ